MPSRVSCNIADWTVPMSSFVASESMGTVCSILPTILAWSKTRLVGLFNAASKLFWEKSMGVILIVLIRTRPSSGY